MNKENFLKNAIIQGCYKKKAWLISAFSVIQEAEDAYKSDPYPYRIVQSQTGMFFVDPKNEGGLTKIEDAVPNQPIFKFSDPIKVTRDVCPNADGEIDTFIGNLLFNLISIVFAFGNKVPFITGKTNVPKIEKIIAARLTDTPEEGRLRDDPRAIYVDEYIKFVDSLTFISGLSQLCVWAETPKLMKAPPGLKEFKASLIEKYKDSLDDPATVAKIEKELIAFDAEYLKGDPGGENFANSNKSRNIVRKKMFLMYGSDQTGEAGAKIDPVINSLDEGWDISKFPQLNDALRAGSYGRGFETRLGGELTKWLLRASSNIRLEKDDCGTKLAYRLFITPENAPTFIGLYEMRGGEAVLLTADEIKGSIGKYVSIRSPMFCKARPTDICKVCAGTRLSLSPTGISLAVSEYGSTIMMESLAKMHGKELAVARMNYKSALT